MAKTAIYIPTGERVTVGRQLNDEGNTYFTVTPVNPAPGGYLRSYQANAGQLRYDSPSGDPQSPGAPTSLPIPFSPNSIPEKPRVAREQEPPSGIDPNKLIWVNDPDVTDEYIADKIKGIGVLSARKILTTRDEEYDGAYTDVNQIPLRIDSLVKYFSLVQINQDPELG